MKTNFYKTFGATLTIFFTICFLPISVKAQDGQNLESAKIAFVTNQLALRPEQAEKFWPLFNEFQGKRKSITHTFKQLRKQLDKGVIADADIVPTINAILAQRDAETALQREYVPKFAKVLTPQQLGKLYTMEQKFRHMMMERMQERRHGQGGPVGQEVD